MIDIFFNHLYTSKSEFNVTDDGITSLRTSPLCEEAEGHFL